MRLVLDTDVMVAALRSNRGASRVLLHSALRREYQLLVSVPLMIEYEAVLKRAHHLRAAGASGRDVDAILDAVAAVGVPVAPVFSWRPLLQDPGDEMVLETAVNGMADAIVSFNVRHFIQAARRFGIQTPLPWQAIAMLEGRN